ncbi:hypothetical protein ACGF8B_05840 [Streptomyces sp. NPDC047917]|uniref:hypothetical protein n=1 Tax=Streptomyces sp. NPDC047917 TaxID=3365491 RepID=UPI0037144F72
MLGTVEFTLGARFGQEASGLWPSISPLWFIRPRIYAHLWPGKEDRTRAVMDAVLGGQWTGCGQVDQAIGEIAGQAA